MLGITRLTDSGGGSARSVAAYMSATEYYRSDNEGNEIFAGARWEGLGAEKLGLNVGSGAEKQFENLLKGLHPKTGKALVRNAKKANRRMGWDLTFSADKSASLLFAAAGKNERGQILAAHHAAVKAATRFLLDLQTCRTGAQGLGEAVKPTGLIIRAVDHIDSRDGDPDLHTHFVLINAALCADGKYRTLDENALLQAKHAAGAVYRQRLASGLKAAGWGIESVRECDADGRETGQIWHKVAGIGNAEQRHFSKRRTAIEAAMAEHGISADQAALKTRRAKAEETTPAVVIAAAAHTLHEWREKGLIDWANAIDLQGVESKALAPVSEGVLLEKLHKTESTFGRFHFIDLIAKERLDAADPVAAADLLLKNMISSGQIIELKDDKRGAARYCSKAQWDLEAEITTAALARQGDTRHRLDQGAVERAIKAHEKRQGFVLSAEQRRQVVFATQETGGVAILGGRAGTGKTASAGAYIEAFKAAGYQMLGTSTAQSAAEKLESETGLTSVSCARLLDGIGRGKIVLTAKTVVVVDEAGMVGAKTLREIQTAVDRAGAKMLLLGDALQLQPVEAGAPFRLIAESQGFTELTEIRRQKTEVGREIAQAFYNGASGQRIVESWTRSGAMRVDEEKAGAVKALVADYVRDERHDFNKMIIANTHADRLALCNELRGALKASGKLGNEQIIEVAGDKMGEKMELAIAPGDRLKFCKNDRGLGVANGEIATLQEIRQDGKKTILSLKIESEIADKNGRIITLDLAKYDRLTYGWAHTAHSAQGQGKSGVYWLATAGHALDRNLGLVAFTRSKDDFHAYTTEAARSVLAERLDEWGTKAAAAEIGRKPTEGEQIAADIAQIALRRRAQRKAAQAAIEQTAAEAIELASNAKIDKNDAANTAMAEAKTAENAMVAARRQATKEYKAINKTVQNIKTEIAELSPMRFLRKAALNNELELARAQRHEKHKAIGIAKMQEENPRNGQRKDWLAKLDKAHKAKAEAERLQTSEGFAAAQKHASAILLDQRWVGGSAAAFATVQAPTARQRILEAKKRKEAERQREYAQRMARREERRQRGQSAGIPTPRPPWA